MLIDFSQGTISLVLVKCDMRLGFAKLSNLAPLHCLPLY